MYSKHYYCVGLSNLSRQTIRMRSVRKKVGRRAPREKKVQEKMEDIEILF